MPPRIQRYAHLVLVGATIVLILGATWSWGSRYNYVPCISDCGETFIAQLYARNFRLFGLNFGLVEDHATSPSPAAHPYYYTHNVNIGGLYYVLLEALGVNSFPAKQFFVLLVFGAGLLYAYAAVAFHTKSRLAAYCVLAAACLDFGFFLAFGLHALRVWTWLALFGLLLHVGRFAQTVERVRGVDAVAILMLGAIAFGIGYEFWIVAMGVAVATHYFFSDAALGYRSCIKRLGALLVLLFIPFVLRQVHIAMVLGTEYWITDFYYSFVAKIPFAGHIFEWRSSEVQEQFYRSHNVMRPPTEAIESVGAFKQSLLALIVGLVHGTLPQAGLMTMVITAVMALGALSVTLFAKIRGKADSKRADERAVIIAEGFDYLGAAKLLAALVVGITLGCLVIPRMVVHFYFALGLPLVGSLAVLAKGLVLALLIMIIRAGFVRPALRGLSFTIAALLIIDHGLVQTENIRAAKPMDTSWASVVSERPRSTYAVSFIAPVVAGFTSNWVIGIKTGREDEMLQAISVGNAPFRKGDLFWFGERDADSRNWEYLSPDYWLYFPTDRRSPFLSSEPNCRSDYLSAFLRSFISHFAISAGKVASHWELPAMAKPASLVTIKLKLNPAVQVTGISFAVDGKVPVTASFNCISNVAVGQLPLPDERPRIREVIALVSIGGRADPIHINLGRIELSQTAQETASGQVPRLQPSVREVLSQYPGISVEHARVTENEWEGFVLIDLRQLRGDRHVGTTGQCSSGLTGAACAR